MNRCDPPEVLLTESSDGRCNTIWYKAAFKGGVWAFRGAEDRRMASLESGANVA